MDINNQRRTQGVNETLINQSPALIDNGYRFSQDS